MPSFGPPAREKTSVAGSRNKGRYLKRNRAPEAVKYQTPVAKRYQYRSDQAALLSPSPRIKLQPCQNASFNNPPNAQNKRFYYPCPAQTDRNDHSTAGRRHSFSAAELGAHPPGPPAHRAKNPS